MKIKKENKQFKIKGDYGLIRLARYPKPEWAVQQIVRASGLVEDICEHGCGHPNEVWLQENDADDQEGLSIHCCCGCCSKSIRDIREGKLNRV